MKYYYKDYRCATYVVSKSERALSEEFEGMLDEVAAKYANNAPLLDMVVEDLERKNLFLFRKELVIIKNGKVVAAGDIIQYLFDFIAEGLRYSNYELEPYLFTFDVEGSMDYINNNTDYTIKCNYDMVI
ncbi:Uncharacterised protein [Veillonella ratti]|uniref:Uncharacterized protein n=1 Tax=Veillonella ratti TaxID=103892 RepID=A0A6N3BUD8_9FIRM